MRIHQLLAGVALAAVMSVAHATTLLVGVDPETGESKFYIASGQGKINKNSDTGGAGTTLNPNEGLSSDSAQPPAPDLTNVTDIDDLISKTSNAIIEAIVASKAAIDQENQEYIAKLQAGGEGVDQEAIDRINKNLDNLVGNIVKNAISQGRIDEKQIQGLIDKINQQLDNKLDLDNTKPAELSEQEKAKQTQLKLLEEERKKKQEAEKLKQEQLKKQNEELQAKLKEQLEKQKAEKQKAEEAAKKKAAEEHAKKLADDAAKKAFEAKQKALAEEKQKQEEAKKKAEEERTAGAVPKDETSKRDEDQSPPSPGGNDQTGGGNNPLIGNGGDGGSPGPGAGNNPLIGAGGDGGSPGPGAGNLPNDPTGGTGADGRYDPNAPVNGQMLHQLVSGSPLPPISPTTLVGMLRDDMAQLNENNAPSNSKPDADENSEDKLLRDFVEQVTTTAGFPYIAAGDVSALPPTESLTGEMSATYNGRLSGAFGDGAQVGGAMALNVSFNEQHIDGLITFDGGKGTANVYGGWADAVNHVPLTTDGGHYDGNPADVTLGGKFYGPKGQEFGGSWGMNVLDGSPGGRNANGQFATKQ